MSTVEEQLAALNATNTHTYGEPAIDVGVSVKGDEVEVFSLIGEKKKRVGVRFPLSELPNVLDLLRNVDKIVNPRPKRGARKPKVDGVKAAAEETSKAADTEGGAAESKRKRKPRKRGSKKASDAEGDAAESTAVAAANSLLNDSSEAPKRRERKPRIERDPNAPDTRVAVDTKATIRNLNYSCTSEDFIALLAKLKVSYTNLDWKVRTGKNSRFSGFCHVEFGSKGECDKAIAALNGYEFQPEGRSEGNSASLIAANYKENAKE